MQTHSSSLKNACSFQSGTLRKINSVVIPVGYSDKFYKDALDSDLDDINKIGA